MEDLQNKTKPTEGDLTQMSGLKIDGRVDGIISHMNRLVVIMSWEQK